MSEQIPILSKVRISCEFSNSFIGTSIIFLRGFEIGETKDAICWYVLNLHLRWFAIWCKLHIFFQIRNLLGLFVIAGASNEKKKNETACTSTEARAKPDFLSI